MEEPFLDVFSKKNVMAKHYEKMTNYINSSFCINI